MTKAIAISRSSIDFGFALVALLCVLSILLTGMVPAPATGQMP